MDAVKFLKERQRMFGMDENNNRNGCGDINCGDCAFYKADTNRCLDINGETEEIVEAIEKWSGEHSAKTYQQDFLEKYPNAKLYEGGYPMVCFSNLGYEEVTSEYCINTDCKDCWNRSME